MSNKKTKIIEFDESMLDLIRKYQEKQGINTFAGAVRNMIESQLIDHQLMEPKAKENDEELFSHQELSNFEKEKWNDLIQFIDCYKHAVNEHTKLVNNDNEYKTLFEYILNYYRNDNLDELVAIFKVQYIKLGRHLYRMDMVMKELILSIDDYRIQSDTLTHIRTLKDINTKKDIIRAFEDATRRVRGYGSIEIEYNKCIKKIYKYKNENESLYDSLEHLCSILDRITYVKGVL